MYVCTCTVQYLNDEKRRADGKLIYVGGMGGIYIHMEQGGEDVAIA